MRALCGAIIAAGALIGLGLASVGVGMRYQQLTYHDSHGDPQWVRFRDLDTALMLAFVVLLLSLVVGLGIAFLGLAYHHHRRHHEFLPDQARQPGGTGTTGSDP